MNTAEKRLRLAWCHHAVERSPVPGYFLCHCGCGYVGVCPHCVPSAPSSIPWKLCDVARQFVQSGQARCQEGFVYAVSQGA